MTDLLRARLRPLAEAAAATAPTVEEIQGRARRVRRRRRVTQAGTALTAVALVAVATLNWSASRSAPHAVVFAPNSAPQDGTKSYAREGVSFDYPADWAVVADPPGPEVIVGTSALAPLDELLAVLVRHDTVFTHAFPGSGAMFVIGNDRLQPVYSGGRTTRRTVPCSDVEDEWPAAEADCTEPVDIFTHHQRATAGPSGRLGNPRQLRTADRRAVTGRFGHYPASATNFAVYVTGPAAATWLQQAEDIVASLELRAASHASEPPPPPKGTPNFPDGEAETLGDAQDVVLTHVAGDIRLTLRVGQSCLAVESDIAGSDSTAGGRCGIEPAPPSTFSSIFVHELAVAPVPDSPGAKSDAENGREIEASTFIVAAAGDGIAEADIRTADNQIVPATVADGWVMAAAPGRIVEIRGYAQDGTVVARAPTP